MSNFKNQGTDLDSIFETRTSPKVADVGYENSGTDISNIYEPLLNDQQIPDIDYSSGGTNLAEIFMGNPGQYTLTPGRLTITRTTAWNGTIDARFTVTFASAAARTDFFTYGGRIKISGTRTGGTASSKNTDWSSIVSGMGTIEFGKTNTYTGSVATDATGDDDLTGTDQIIYDGTNAGTGSYAENDMYVYARENSATVIDFRIVLTDSDVGDPSVDENVDGTLTFTVDERRYPTLAAPTYSLTNSL